MSKFKVLLNCLQKRIFQMFGLVLKSFPHQLCKDTWKKKKKTEYSFE